MTLFLALIFFIANQVYAQTPNHSEQTLMLKSPTTPELEYQGFIQSSRNFISFQQWYFKNTPSLKSRERLLDQFDKAKLGYLKIRKSDAKKETILEFKKVIDAALSENWTEGERGAIFDSYFYLADLSESEDERKFWIHSAIQFDWNSEPHRWFNEKLRKIWLEKSADVFKKSIKWKFLDSVDKDALILINGRLITPESDGVIYVPQGVHRITVLTNSHAPLVENIEASNLPGHEFFFRPLVDGSCQRPQIVNLMHPSFQVIYPGKCVRSFQEGKWVIAEDLPVPPGAPDVSPITESLSATQDTSARFYKKPLFWAGVGAVVLGALIYKSQTEKKNNDSQNPSVDKYSALTHVFEF